MALCKLVPRYISSSPKNVVCFNKSNTETGIRNIANKRRTAWHYQSNSLSKSFILDLLFLSLQNDITLDGYQKYKRNVLAPAPLTTREEELQEIKRAEINTDYNIDSRHQTLSGVSFPITMAAKQSILDMERGSYEYLQFKIGKYIF